LIFLDNIAFCGTESCCHIHISLTLCGAFCPLLEYSIANAVPERE
jgi:hypothetical protein